MSKAPLSLGFVTLMTSHYYVLCHDIFLCHYIVIILFKVIILGAIISFYP